MYYLPTNQHDPQKAPTERFPQLGGSTAAQEAHEVHGKHDEHKQVEAHPEHQPVLVRDAVKEERVPQHNVHVLEHNRCRVRVLLVLQKLYAPLYI